MGSLVELGLWGSHSCRALLAMFREFEIRAWVQVWPRVGGTTWGRIVW